MIVSFRGVTTTVMTTTVIDMPPANSPAAVVTIYTKLLITIDRASLCIDYGLDPHVSDIHAELAEMLANDVQVDPADAGPGDPLAELGAAVSVDPTRPWERYRIKCSSQFLGMKFHVVTQVSATRIRARFGMEPVHLVPHWLTARLAQRSVIRDHSGTVVPLIPGR